MSLAFVLLIVSFLTHVDPPALPAPQTAAARESYQSADIDAAGSLRIVTSDHRTILVPKGGGSRAGASFGRQTAFAKPVLSEDRRAVGAQALFENCCTSYDIPLQLLIYSNGRAHRFEGGLAIFDWHFVDAGHRVAFSQQTVHSACAVHWELRDVASERLLARVDIPEECGQAPRLPKVNVPKWVTGWVSGLK